jgi:hypothetical protein
MSNGRVRGYPGAKVPRMARASRSDQDYFARVGSANRALGGEGVPGSLAEMFDRLEEIRRTCGALAEPGVRGAGEGDWPSHLAFLERIRTLGRRGGAKRA